ncbi:hypothetical protein BS47DRAFT_757677 [Hydnum rufescens UP504]|uniref:Uncharacterized protein n=1 Tax=Hydnum rufescens UP504 TaxID=1448309 RepID=A0A9P6BCS3_9AGAM|nr:hypothetical protein BS47DRAFT_757677 [Hydnum rufescens UP504]
MPFETVIRNILEHCTSHTPATADRWYGSWNGILGTLFTPDQGYAVAPRGCLHDDSEGGIPGSIFEVVKLSPDDPTTFRTILIAEIQNTQLWESGIPALQRQLNLDTDRAFSDTAHSKVYWIETIGPHWRYGEKEHKGQDARPLIDWHHTTHDQASFDDLQTLRSLVATALEKE